MAPKFKAFEEGSPGGVNGGGIGFPSIVEFLEKRGVSRMADPTQGWGRRGGGAVWVLAIENIQGGILTRIGFRGSSHFVSILS